MKKILASFVLMGTINAVQAQVSITPEIGIGTNIRSNLIHKWNPSIKIGGGVDFSLSKHFGIESGVYYNLKSYSNTTPSFSNKSAIWHEDISVKRHQLQLPIIGKFSYKLNKDLSLFCGAGMYIGGYISSHTSRDRKFAWQDIQNGDIYEMLTGKGYTDNGISNDQLFNEQYSNDYGFDWGASGNIGIEMKQLRVKLSYDLSLSKENTFDKISPNYHTLTLSVGYKFNLNK